MIIDIHTHGSPQKKEGTLSITNIRAGIDNSVCTYPFSYGIHPYDVEKIDIEFALAEIDRLNPLAIGEIGMDFRFPETAKKQSIFFKKQVEKADIMSKPVIIHAVKSLPQILEIMAKHSCHFAIHGFRGTIVQAEKIVQNGGYFSICPCFPKETKELFHYFKEHILLETDETGIEISDHYNSFAKICGTSLNELETTIENNYFKWIGNREHCYC